MGAVASQLFPSCPVSLISYPPVVACPPLDTPAFPGFSILKSATQTRAETDRNLKVGFGVAKNCLLRVDTQLQTCRLKPCFLFLSSKQPTNTMLHHPLTNFLLLMSGSWVETPRQSNSNLKKT